MTTFLLAMLLFGGASVLNAIWTQQVINNRPIHSGITAGCIRMLMMMGMWYAFVDEDYTALGGCVIGEAIGSYMGVKLWNRLQKRKAAKKSS